MDSIGGRSSPRHPSAVGADCVSVDVENANRFIEDEQHHNHDAGDGHNAYDDTNAMGCDDYYQEEYHAAGEGEAADHLPQQDVHADGVTKKQGKQRGKRKGDKRVPLLRQKWLCITPDGESSVLEADKYKLTAQLGIQTRDLRLLDPAISTAYPSAILCRQKSIVVNLEHIKVIVTIDRALVVDHGNKANQKFVEELKARIARPGIAASKVFPSAHDLQRVGGGGMMMMMDGDQGFNGGGNAALSNANLAQHNSEAAAAGGGVHGKGVFNFSAGGDMGTSVGGGPTPAPPPPPPPPPLTKQGLGGSVGMGMVGLMGAVKEAGVQLPFELRVLEICLDEIASEYEMQTTALEGDVSHACDTLIAKVTSPHLERVRKLKNRLVRLTTRVETLREVLEKFLNDDEDMHDLNLTANQERDDRDSLIAGGSDLGPPHPHHHHSLHHHHHDLDHQSNEDGLSFHMGRRVSTRSTLSSVSTNSSIVENEIAEVEMLLEAYFMNIDQTYNRLNLLNEYITDTEDLVAIKLDQHRNQLITTDLILTAFTASMAIITTIAGIFGMNLDSQLQEAPNVFNEVTLASCLGALLLFVGFVVWAWRFGLLIFN